MAETFRPMSLFDVLGPVMTGPSSSATAGSARIGRVARALLGGSPDKIRLTFTENFGCKYRGNFTDAAAIGALMGFAVDAPEIRDARKIAAERGIDVAIDVKPEPPLSPDEDDGAPRPIAIELRISRGSDKMHVIGLSVGGGEIEIAEVEGFKTSFTATEDMLLAFADGDVSAEVKKALGSLVSSVGVSVNGGKYLMVCTLEKPADESAVSKVKAVGGVTRVCCCENILDYKFKNSSDLMATIEDIVRNCAEKNVSIADLAVMYESERSGLTKQDIIDRASIIWTVMETSAAQGLKGKNATLSRLVPGDAGHLLAERVKGGKSFCGNTAGMAAARALACMEYDACMGRVVAAPTAGACGVVPGALLSAAELLGSPREKVVEALIVSAAVGTVIARRAPVSGTRGGCQSEVGVASAMAAAALVYLDDGTPEQSAHAIAIALKNILGLVCDPVAGAVEVPCIKRNAMGVVNAMVAADMALAGVKSAIPADETVTALCNVQKMLPVELRASAKGGLGITPTAVMLTEKRLKEMAEG